MQHKPNYELQIFPHVKVSDHIVVVWFHIFTFFKRSSFQSVIRVISSASLSLIFIWWLSWVPVSTSITMSLSVNSYKHVSMNKAEFFFWLMVAVTLKTNTTIDCATTLAFRILCLLWKPTILTSSGMSSTWSPLATFSSSATAISHTFSW